MSDHSESFNPMLGTAATVTESAFPSEVFSCPYCGQMLGAACRVCVACKRSINPADIRKSEPILETVDPQAQPALARARFSWPIFFIVLGVSWVAATVSLQVVGLNKSQLIIGLVQIISSAWVFFDAHGKRVAKPLRWGIGSLFVWIVVFPWYLARRRTPQAPVPFVEAESTPRTRVLLIALAAFLLIGLALLGVKGPA